jgi:putative nucleotidyltransferase with HDIG domain
MVSILIVIGFVVCIFLVLYFTFNKKVDENKSVRDQHPVKNQYIKEKNDDVVIFDEESNYTSDQNVFNGDISEGDFLDIFIKRSSKEVWVGDFIPLTPDKLESNLEREIKAKLKVIPPLPSVAQELIVAMGDESASSSKVADLASKDPVLVGKILQLVNSSFFGLRQEVTSIGRAIVLLGFNSIKNFVLQSQLSRAIPKIDSNMFSLENYWIHSLASSTCAYHITSSIQNLQSSIVSTVALLHDIGKLAIAFYKPEAFKQYTEQVNTDPMIPSLMIEERIFGVNHALVGFLLAENWELPEFIRSIILYHHHPTFVSIDQIPENIREAVSVVHISDLLCKLCGFSIANEDVTGLKDEYFHVIGKNPPLELLIDHKASIEMQKSKYFVKTKFS